MHAGGRISDPKSPPPILGGLLTTGSDWTPPLGGPFRSALHAPDQQSQLNLGCIVNAAGWRFEQPDGTRPYVQLSAEGEALVHFYLNLLAELQQLGTVPAMDFDVWRALLVERTLT